MVTGNWAQWNGMIQKRMLGSLLPVLNMHGLLWVLPFWMGNSMPWVIIKFIQDKIFPVYWSSLLIFSILIKYLKNTTNLLQMNEMLRNNFLMSCFFRCYNPVFMTIHFVHQYLLCTFVLIWKITLSSLCFIFRWVWWTKFC